MPSIVYHNLLRSKAGLPLLDIPGVDYKIRTTSPGTQIGNTKKPHAANSVNVSDDDDLPSLQQLLDRREQPKASAGAGYSLSHSEKQQSGQDGLLSVTGQDANAVVTKGSGAQDDPIVLDEDEEENGQVNVVELEDDIESTTETASTQSCFGSRANSPQNESIKEGSAQSFIDPISTVGNAAKSGHLDTEAITSRSTRSPRNDATSMPSPEANPQSKQFHAAPEPSPQPDPVILSRERSAGAPEPTTPPNESHIPSIDVYPQVSALSRKRPYPQVEDDSSPRRSRRTRVETQKVVAAGGRGALFESLKKKGLGLGHAFSRRSPGVGD